MSEETSIRKIEHIEVVLQEDIICPGLCNDIYSQIRVIHKAFPLLSLEDINLSIKFLGKTLDAPLIITGITGGHPESLKINEKLAALAEKHGIAIGVGSQRAMLEKNDVEIVETFRIVRRKAPSVPLIGNIGINTLQDLSIRDVEYIVEAIDADALAIHLNPGQELIQPEGDTRFTKKALNKLVEVIDTLSVPIIIKEVGNGISMEVASLFYRLGVRYFDVAGACGTNWILVEGVRAARKGYRDKALLAKKLANWGIPTPISVIETRWAAPNSVIIASGGVWDGYKAAINIVLGADLCGIALPILKLLVRKGFNEADTFLANYINELAAIAYLLGASNIDSLKKSPFILSSNLYKYFEQRGIDLNKYMLIKHQNMITGEN